MKHLAPLACLALIAQAPAPLFAQAAAAQAAGRVTPSPLAPSEIVAAAPASDWIAIAASDLLVMELAPSGGPSTRSGLRRVVIQLMPPPFSQGWVGNIRKLAAARWWDATSINRVQDNYVVQWGDASEKKVLPTGLVKVAQSEYFRERATSDIHLAGGSSIQDRSPEFVNVMGIDAYGAPTAFYRGWPFAGDVSDFGIDLPGYWPVHCYGMVGVGRDMPPNTGTGAELYTVIGHAPRHLDRNIALVGRVIEGIEHLSSLPRGRGALGFYEKAEERVPIVSVRLGSEAAGLPRFEYLSTESGSFARYADARANRRDAFFIRPAGGADVCNIPVPVRRVAK